MNQKVNLQLKFKETLAAVINYKGISDKRAGNILLLIVILTAVFRLLTIQFPAIDRTDWKEIDYIMISKNYYEHGYNLLKPETWWPAEEPRVTAVEFPIVPYVASLLYPIMGINAFSIRLITFITFLLFIVYMYWLTKREAGTVLALVTALFAAVEPMFNSFGNLLFSEPIMVFFSVFAMYYYVKWVDKPKGKDLILFILGFSLAVALKPTTLYLAIPLFWIHFRKYRFEVRKYWSFVWSLSLGMIIPVAWYIYAYFIAKNNIDVFGVFGGAFGGHDKFQTITMLTNMQWYLVMFWRLKLHVFGVAGLLFMGTGVISSFYLKKGDLFTAYLLAIICFFVIVAEGNMDTPYRQLTIIPAAAFFLALGVVTVSVFIYTLLHDRLSIKSNMISQALPIAFCVILLMIFPIRKRADFISFDKNRPVHPRNWLLAQEIKKYATDSSKIILAGEYTIHKGGNDVSPITYYYSNVRGWTIQKGEWNEQVVNDLKKKGADLFGAIDYGREPEMQPFLDELSTKYQVLYSNPDEEILLLDLKKPTSQK